jgi:hypothetical protein
MALVTLAGASRGAEPAGALTPAQIAETAIPSVVLIRTPLAQGTGFVAGPDGRIVTNFHVIRGATQVTIVTSDHTEFAAVEVMALDEARDLAVLRIHAPGLKALPLGDSGAVRPGEHVVAIGNPLGLGDTVSDGLLSAVRQDSRLSLLQISAPISPGSSGGPVFNDRGQVIGVSTLVLNGGQNLNFAIPINAVKTMLAGDRGTPLAAAHLGKGLVRNVPDLPLTTLAQCPAPQFAKVVGTISRAIDVGAPLYNQGNFEACYRIYEGAALEVQRDVTLCPGPKRALADGLSHAETRRTWSDKAWAMRDSFDGVLGLVVKLGNGQAAAGGLQRHIPEVPVSAVDECPTPDLAAIAGEIGSAVDSGAPLYNQGNAEATVRIYEGAIGEIDRKFDHCPAARHVLDDGVRAADAAQGWQAKAWALRDAFDGLMNAIGRRQSSAR